MRNTSVRVWLLILAFLLGVLNLPEKAALRVKGAVREAGAPLQRAVVLFAARLREAAGTFRGLGGVLREHQDMSAELVRLSGQVRRLEGLERENLMLRRQLDFMTTSGGQLTPGEVVGRDVGGWWESVRLAKGKLHGLRPGQAVITTDGLVGRVREVTPRTAEILLISDPSFRMSALLPRTDTYGVLSGRGADVRGRPLCRMDFIDRNTPIRPGDEVVSSGLGGVFSRGLLAGYVEKVHRHESGLYQSADILLRADLNALHYVFVVTDDLTEENLLRRRLENEGGGGTP